MSILCSEKLDLNTATQTQLGTLDISSEQIESIISLREQLGSFETIFDLQYSDTFSMIDIHRLKPFVTILPLSTNAYQKDLQRSSYKVNQWVSNEGSTEGLSEVWLDQYYHPENINDMNYDDLYALPNLSPIDVVAVLKQQQRGEIKGNFELKNSPGISRWGYKNLIDFVRFDETSTSGSNIHFRFNSLIRTIPTTTNPDDEGNISAFQDLSIPEEFHKFLVSSGDHYKFGSSYHRYMGQPSNIYNEKYFFQIEKMNLGWIDLDRLVLGNFTAAFGQSVLFESSDYFSPRRTGMGFTKRADGIRADQTRSCQYVLNGGAIQVSNSNFRGIFFASLQPRDAIINSDSSFTSLIVMQPRLPFGSTGDTTLIFHELTNALNELTWGANFRISPILGTNIGFTFYESLYDRQHIPQIKNTITGGDPDYSGDETYLVYMTNSADPEIAAMDTSIAESPLWDEALSFKRARGFDFSTVIKNIAIQGEYGELFTDHQLFNFGRNPAAYVINAYTQFDNFNLLVLYRNYDLEYDNPYQRSFSNYQRFKTTIFEDSYWLEDPIYSFLYSGNPQPQAEEGIFISSRYQFHRNLTGTLNWDTWNRQADDAKYYRTVATIEWRPVFNYRIKIRQKWQQRGAFDIQHPSPFYSRETRITSRLRLSNYNQLELLYTNGYTTFSPRPRLTDNADGGDMVVGNIGSPDESIGLSFNHILNDNVTIKFGGLYIQGFLWYFEDTDFRIFNQENGAVHSWVSFALNPISSLRVNMKLSHTHSFSSTTITAAQAPEGNWIHNPLVSGSEINFRLQVSYAL